MSPQREPALRVRDLTKQFGSARALRGVDLELRHGEFVTLFGPNGAGKTTLVRVLSTLARPSQGHVEIFGVTLGRGVAADLRRRIGVVSHRSFLYRSLTARENLVFYARMFDVPDPGGAADRVLETIGLHRRCHDLVAGFSRGMEQRCAIGRALVHDPDLLLLDEPFSGLDPDAADRLWETLRRMHGGHRTILLTSHDLGRGATLAQRVAFLSSGRLLHDGPADELDPDTLRSLYGPGRAR